MKRELNVMVRLGLQAIALVAISLLLWPAAPAFAQGVTTGALNGIVTNEQQQPIQAANVIAIHLAVGDQLRDGDPGRRQVHDPGHAARWSL